MSNNDTLLSGRYKLIKRQAAGGMAVVWRATDTFLDRTVAIKVLRPSLLSNDPQGGASFISRFTYEAQSVARLVHPNIVTIHDVGAEQTKDGTLHFMVMEFVSGSDLKQLIREQGKLQLDVALNLAIQICAGMGFAHRAKIVHADIKPQNILLTRDPDRVVKITDFGIAQAIIDTQTQTPQKSDVVWGSPHYFSPEQAKGEKPTSASDVYSIGIVIFEMLTGQVPYVGTSQQELAMAHIREPIPDVRSINPDVPEELAKIIKKVMNKEPSQRFRTADHLAQALVAFQQRYRGMSGQVQKSPPPSASVADSSASERIPDRPSTIPRTGPAKPIPPPPDSTPGVTQQVNAAPNAPNPDPYRRKPTMPPLQEVHEPNSSGMAAANIPAPNQQPSMGYSQSYQVQYEDDAVRIFDAVTIILIILAFFAIVGLIPLYISVWQLYT